MVSGIDSNFYDLGSIRQDLEMLDASNGLIAPTQKENLTTDVNYFLDNLGDKTDVELTITEVDKLLEAQASKEVMPDMDMDLDISDIPDAKSIKRG